MRILKLFQYQMKMLGFLISKHNQHRRTMDKSFKHNIIFIKTISLLEQQRKKNKFLFFFSITPLLFTKRLIHSFQMIWDKKHKTETSRISDIQSLAYLLRYMSRVTAASTINTLKNEKKRKEKIIRYMKEKKILITNSCS